VEALAVNSTGQITGYAKTRPSDSYVTLTHAFLYSGGSMVDLGTLGGGISNAYAIGKNGHVVGSSYNSAGYVHAFLWNNGRMQDLGTLTGHPESYAFGVNDSGHAVGFSGTMFVDERAFLRAGGAMQDLGTLGGPMSRALAINNSGHVVGYSQNANFLYRAFLYSNGAMRDLGVIGSAPFGSSQAVAINDKGQIAGHSTVGPDLLTFHACVWSNGSVTDLGSLTGFPYSYAKSINDAGHVVGFVAPVDETIAGDAKRAFVYRNGRMLNLNDAIPLKSPWTLLQANSINDNGQIVGVGKVNNKLRGFLLTPLQ
jgi:probable HAF family extracellular repeat protein